MESSQVINSQFPEMSTPTSDVDNSTQKSEAYSTLKEALYKRELLKINCMLNDHLSLRTVTLEDIQKLIHRVFKDSKGILLQQTLIVDTLRLLHDKGANLNEKDSKERTLLQLAVKCRLTEVIDFLLSNNVDLHDSSGNSILHYLITSETSMLTKELNRRKKVSQNYFTPVKKQSTDFINWMLLKGFSIDCQNNNGDTVLHLAAKYNLLHALPILLEHSKNVAITNDSGMNAFQILLNSVTNYGENPKNKKNKVNRLNTEMYIPTNCYESSFIDEIYKMFASKGFSIDVVDNNGCTPLHLMLMQHRPKLVKFMLDYFTNVNARDKDGNTVLHIAMNNIKHAGQMRADYHEIVRILVLNGANVCEMNNDGVSPLIDAIVDHKETLLKVFTEPGVILRDQHEGRNLLHYICRGKFQLDDKSCRDAFKFLINEGYNVNSKDYRGKTPLHYAVQHSRIKIVEALIECGADVNVRESIMGYTPLHEAVKYGREELLTVLVKNGADINATTDSGDTPLSFAKNSRKGLKNTLIKLGATGKVEEDDGFFLSYNTFWRRSYQMMKNSIGRSMRLNPAHEKLRDIIKDNEILRSCKDNPIKCLYYLMHINRNAKCPISVKNKNLEKLIAKPNVKTWLSKVWDAKGKKMTRSSKKGCYANRRS